jgi:hypothetical protein
VIDPVRKVLAVLVGAAFVVGAGWFGLEAWRDYRAFGDAPARSALLTAVESSTGGRRWVSVEVAPWRCGDMMENVPGGAAFVPATAPDGSIVVARFDHEINCWSVVTRPLVGVIEPMKADRAADLRAAGLALPEGARLRTLEVCAFCGKSNSRLGVIMCAGLMIVGLLMYPLMTALQSLRERVGGALHGAIHAPPEGAAQADLKVRVWGAALLAIAAAAFVLGEGWVVYEVVPVRGVGVVAAALGLWMAVLPGHYRRAAARGRGAR